jgi:hypothetical protein
MSGLLLEGLKFIKGLAPVADAFAGTVVSDVVDMSDFNRIVFCQFTGVGTTGTSTITVEACDDIVPTTTSAVPFHSRSITGADTEAAVVARAAAGYTTVAGSARRMPSAHSATATSERSSSRSRTTRCSAPS